jgi:hypothetical protein
MLTGTPSFAASDPVDWVHCHIVRKPGPPSTRFETVAAPVSGIFVRWLAKTVGVESDLKRCLAEWELWRRIDESPRGQHDTPDRLLIPEKLYGRAAGSGRCTLPHSSLRRRSGRP